MGHKVVAMRMAEGPFVKIENVGIKHPIPLELPKGCIGMLFCFESKKSAREYFDKDVALMMLEGIK